MLVTPTRAQMNDVFDPDTAESRSAVIGGIAKTFAMLCAILLPRAGAFLAVAVVAFFQRQHSCFGDRRKRHLRSRIASRRFNRKMRPRTGFALIQPDFGNCGSFNVPAGCQYAHGASTSQASGQKSRELAQAKVLASSRPCGRPRGTFCLGLSSSWELEGPSQDSQTLAQSRPHSVHLLL